MFFERLFGKNSLGSVARRAGYVKDQMGIRSRYVRESEHWNEHLERTKRYILAAAEDCEGRESVAVLGSGWLLDVPIEELSQMFGMVYLFDIVHPEPVVVKMKRFPAVRLLSADLTGGAVELAERSASFQDFLATLERLPSFQLPDCDLVISVNLLNQLDIILCDFLAEKFSATEDELLCVRRIVQQRHIDCLPKGKTCLITDFCEVNQSIADQSVTEKPLLHCQLPGGAAEQEWTWTFDTNQRYHKGFNTTMKVKGLRL